MKQNTIHNYLATSSLFKTAKPAPSHIVQPEALKNSFTPTRTQYTPVNPINFKAKEPLLCRSCQDKNKSRYVRESKRLNQLQGIERDLQSRNAAISQPVPQKETYDEVVSSVGTRHPPNYINESDRNPKYLSKTVEMNQNRAYVLQKTVPTSVYNREPLPQRTVQPFVLPITQQQNMQDSTSKEADILKRPPQTQISRKTNNEDMNILINNEKESRHQGAELLPNQNGNLTPSYRFQMARTESNLFMETDAKEESEIEVKKWTKPQSQRRQSPQAVDSEKRRIIRGGSNFQRIVSNTPLSIIRANTDRETITNSDLNREINYLDDETDRNNFFNSTKRDTNKYIQNIRIRLRESYRSLSVVQAEIDTLIDKNLDLQCEKIKINLYKAIDLQLKDFRESQRKKLTNTKFSYMSDLYELKCNIDLRLQELEDYQMAFSSEHKWKSVVGDLLTPDYESTIQFLVSKSAQIQEDSISYTQNFISEYNTRMFIEVLEPLKKQIKLAINNLFQNFIRLREKKHGNQNFINKYFEDEVHRTKE